ncbi:MAG: hypothetical protein ACE5EC_02840 [Phycisphaerae bacterium]
MPEFNPLICEKCGGDLEPDDAISVIEGVCAPCRSVAGMLVQPLRADQLLALNGVESAASVTDDWGMIPESRDVERGGHAIGDPSDPSDAMTRGTRTPAGSAPSGKGVPMMTSGPATIASSVIHRDEGLICPPTPPFPARPSPRTRRRRRDLTVGITVGLIVTLMATGYFLYRNPTGDRPAEIDGGEQARLKLRIRPIDAEVKLNGEGAGRLDASGRLSLSVPTDDLDEQWLEISAPGYYPVRQPLGVYRGAPEALIELVHRPYEVRVVTEPPDAEIWIDDELQGRSPLTLTLNTPRPGRMVAHRKGYVDLWQTIDPPTDGEPLSIHLDLVRAGVTLAVSSEPRDAVIRLDGEPRGVSPVTLELGPDYLGRTIELTASAAGYDDAHLKTTLPEVGGDEGVSIGLVLVRAMSVIEVRTNPPGGRIVIAGRDFGMAPVWAEFESNQTGEALVIEASLGGTHFGRETLSIPATGQPLRLTIPLAFSAQRVVFVLASPDCAAAEHYRLIERLTDRIHGLHPSQRFAVLAATDDGVSRWPGDSRLEDASSEQKVRAYDQVRSVRPSGWIDLSELLEAAKALGPTSVWMFLGGELDREGMERFQGPHDGAVFSVNVVRVASAPDDAWLDAWTARHHGTHTVLDRNRLPVLAMDENAER